MNHYISLITNALATLDDRASVQKHDILSYEYTATKFQLKLRIEFTDSSVLYTNEYIGANHRKYAFQWQTADGIWLVRWDNVPHFPNLASFPHHQHDYRTGEEIVNDRFDLSLIEVLEYIDNLIAKPQP